MTYYLVKGVQGYLNATITMEYHEKGLLKIT